jgi:hypothetical protein
MIAAFVPSITKTEDTVTALSILETFLQTNNLLKFSKNLPIQRLIKFIPLIGVPTHHNETIAFQIPATPIMEGIVDLHHDIMVFLVFTLILVLYLLLAVTKLFPETAADNIHGYAGDNTVHNTVIELI